MGPVDNQFGYNEHLAIMSRFLCFKIIDSNVKKFSYNEHPLITSSFFCFFFTCKRDPVYVVCRKVMLSVMSVSVKGGGSQVNKLEQVHVVGSSPVVGGLKCPCGPSVLVV